MQAKLTLVLRKNIIDQAKSYARSRGQSVSKLVEGYFALLAKSPNPEQEEVTPLVHSLSGVIKIPPKMNWRKDKEEHLTRKFL